MSGTLVEGGAEEQYAYDYARHKVLFDSEDDGSVVNWEDRIESIDVPLLVDMSHWIGCITRSTLPYDMFMDKISDGTVLCNFGNAINVMTGFGARRQISNIMYPDTDTSEADPMISYDRHNIASFLQWCKNYGLEREWLFSVSDLADRQDGRRVLRALLWVGRLAHKRGVPAPQIAKIEEKYGMRYYTFMVRIISEPQLPATAFFKEDEEQMPKDKRGSRISVTSFFGRRSSRNSVSSNLSAASGNLASIQEDRKRSIIGGGDKKEKKKKKNKKGSAAVEESPASPVNETELIVANTELQQIYMQVLSLLFHKGYQRAKPRGHVMAALEEWQEGLHGTDPYTVPAETFTTLTRRTNSRQSTGSPPPEFDYTFSADPAPVAPIDPMDPLDPTVDAQDPLARAMLADSSSDGAFADEEIRAAQLRRGSRSTPDGGVRPGSGASGIRPDSRNSGMRPDSRASGGKRPDSRTSWGQGRAASRTSLTKEERVESLVHNTVPGSAAVDSAALDEAADEEIRSITEDDRAADNSHSTSININPRIEGFEYHATTPEQATRDGPSPRTRLSDRVKSPQAGHLEDQVIRDSDKVDIGPGVEFDETAAAAAATDREQRPRSRQFSRSQSATGGTGLTFGQILLVIMCPCRLCFGTRRAN